MRRNAAKKWSTRPQDIKNLNSLLRYDVLYLGGGNGDKVINPPGDVRIESNHAGITDGIRLWDADVEQLLFGYAPPRALPRQDQALEIEDRVLCPERQKGICHEPSFKCDVNGAASPLPHFWEHTLGSDHALMALRADWREQMRRGYDEFGFRHLRFRDLLCDDVGTLIFQGDKRSYSFHNADQIFDFLLSICMKPFVELSFMPGTVPLGDKTIFHYRANVTLPKDYAQ